MVHAEVVSIGRPFSWIKTAVDTGGSVALLLGLAAEVSAGRAGGGERRPQQIVSRGSRELWAG